MNIDESTPIMVLGVASITASAMFFALHASARHIAGVRLWASACLSVGFAVLLDAPRLIENWQWASLLFNIPLSAGQALFLVGTAHFVGRPTNAAARTADAPLQVTQACAAFSVSTWSNQQRIPVPAEPLVGATVQAYTNSSIVTLE